MDDMKLLYCTDSLRIGRHDWRVEVRKIEGEGKVVAVPMFRRVGDTTGQWSYPADFPGALPSGLINYVLQNAVPIGRALS